MTTVKKVRRVNQNKSDNSSGNLILRTAKQQCADHMASIGLNATPFLRMYKAGWSLEQIAKDTKKSVGTVCRVLKREGLPIKVPQIPVRVVLDYNKDDVLKLHADGVSWREIARRYDLDSTSVRKTLRTWGLSPTHTPLHLKKRAA